MADCPDGSDLVLCFDQENSDALARDVAKLIRYAAEAHARCGPADK